MKLYNRIFHSRKEFWRTEPIDETREPILKLKLTRNFKQRDYHSAQRETLSKRIGDAVFLLAQDLRDNEEIIEEEYFSLMHTRSLLLVNVWNLVQPTVAN